MKMKSISIIGTIVFSLSSLFVHGQNNSISPTYKGKLNRDSISGKYVYERDCNDHLIVSGRATLLKKKNHLWLYEIKYDSVYFSQKNLDSTTQKLKTVYVLVHNFERHEIEQTNIFLLRIIYNRGKESFQGDQCKYYQLNGTLKYRKDEIVKIEPPAILSLGWTIKPPCNDVTIWVYKKWLFRPKRNKFDEIVLNRQRKLLKRLSH